MRMEHAYFGSSPPTATTLALAFSLSGASLRAARYRCTYLKVKTRKKRMTMMMRMKVRFLLKSFFNFLSDYVWLTLA
jgi:hypothetical protein